MSEKKQQNIFGQCADAVDGFFAKRYYQVGLCVATRPCSTIAGVFLFCLICMGGFSQIHVESRPEKLWIPQDTKAQDEMKEFESYFPPMMRMERVLLEAKSGSAVDKPFLTDAMILFDKLKATKSDKDTLETLCIPRPGDSPPCMISSVLSLWNFNANTLGADANPLGTINAAGKSQKEMNALLGGAIYDSNGKLVSAKALTITFFMQSNEEEDGPGGRKDDRGDDWEEQWLKTLKCEKSSPDAGCSYSSDKFDVYATAQRSMSDTFGNVIRGDVKLINMAFLIMIVYLSLNLGGLCHKIKSRFLLALGCIITVVLAGGAGYGLAMWFQFDYAPVMSVMPFVLLGLGVDDSFVIVNALDRVDQSLEVPQRIATAISHAGVSIMVTSMTDFAAFAISASSALPALGAFCMFAALSILMLFVLQVTVFTAFATFDSYRTDKGLIDCCPCICRKGCPCCPTVPVDEAITEDGVDKNQMCCAPAKHQGGRVGSVLENYLAPLITTTPVNLIIIFISLGFCGLCAWQMTELNVEDAMGKFIPDDSYVHGTMKKMDTYFGTMGTKVDIVTKSGDYFSQQSALANIGSRLDKLDYLQERSAESYSSWVDSFRASLKANQVAGVKTDSNGYATVKSEYYAGLHSWLKGQGGRFAKDVIWVDKTDPQKGIRAARISTEFKNFNKIENDKLLINTDEAVRVMDGLRDAASSWSDVPGGAFSYTFRYLGWEVFRIIKREMFMNVGLCMIAVLVITMVFLAHPVTGGLVLLCVAMIIVDILGCMKMWGLAIDNVTVIQLVVAVGLAVDYSAHVAHGFMTKDGTRAERVKATLGDVGSAVLNGGVSTFLAVMLLAVSKSYVFRVLFMSLFLTVVLGLAHGMIVLPAFLCLIGPQGYSGRAEAHSKSVEPVPDKVGASAGA